MCEPNTAYFGALLLNITVRNVIDAGSHTATSSKEIIDDWGSKDGWCRSSLSQSQHNDYTNHVKVTSLDSKSIMQRYFATRRTCKQMRLLYQSNHRRYSLRGPPSSTADSPRKSNLQPLLHIHSTKCFHGVSPNVCSANSYSAHLINHMKVTVVLQNISNFFSSGPAITRQLLLMPR